MRRKPLHRLLAGLFLLSGLAALAADFPWDDFKPRLLKQLVAIDLKTAERTPTSDSRVIFPSAGIASKVTVGFAGESRPLSREKKELVERWALLQKANRAFAQSYEEEFQFTENGRSYWLALQKPVAIEYRRQAKKGGTVVLYLFSGVGGVRVGNDWDWALLVAEYQVPH